jgi:dolichol-phosphate mannosyltransferase
MARVFASLVVPTFNEARSLPRLSARVRRVLDAEDLDWEVLFVDDGSSDDSFAEIRKLHAADARFKCLRLSRNFGSHVAISAGLEHASGDVAIVITADLEEPPETIPELLRMWSEGYRVVWGVRASRRGRGLDRLAARAFHRVFAWLAEQGPDWSDIGGGLFLVDAEVLAALRRCPERNRNLVGLLLWSGFKQGRVTYEPASRAFGSSKWSAAKKIRLALDTFVGFSSRPLRMMLVGGVGCALTGVVVLVVALASVAHGGSSGAGLIASVIGAATLIVGVQLMASGLLGEYVSRTLDEARGRPLYVLMDRLGETAAAPRVQRGPGDPQARERQLR